jgi:glycosyltransferase involved in cell wall biosynthesis
VTIHDLAYFFMDVHGSRLDEMLQSWTRRSLALADAVIALSESTRADLMRLGVSGDRVSVIYGGANIVADSEIAYDRAAELRSRLRLPERYILFVGSIQPRKNVPYLLRAYAKLRASGRVSHGLVLAGQRSNASKEVEELIRNLDIEDHVVITGYVDDWELPLLYRMSDLFVLPTRYEGFTLVTLEAMSYGIPVIATDCSSIREGTGDAAILVEVDNDEALTSAMQQVLADQALRRSLVERGKRQAARFTWQANAERTLDLYRSLAEPLTALPRQRARAHP